MAHPKTKEELLSATARERDALQAYLTGLSPEQMLQQGEYGWSATDHLIHLAEWERMLFGWYEAGLRGESPAVPAEGYGWADMDALNRASTRPIAASRRNAPWPTGSTHRGA